MISLSRPTIPTQKRPPSGLFSEMRRNDKARISEEETALELWGASLRRINSYAMANSFSDVIDADRRLLSAVSITEQAAQDDRLAAEALQNGEQLPPLTDAQRVVGDSSFWDFLEPILEGDTLENFSKKSLKVTSNKAHVVKIKSRAVASTPLPGTSQVSKLEGSAPVKDARLASEAVRGMKPCYLRYNYWGEVNRFSPTLADWSETAKPLPDPPQAELNNPVVLRTLARFPSLFKIVTPIKVDIFEDLLVGHPNPAFVESVCKGLRQGFWPFANTHPGEYPDKFDMSSKMPRNSREAQFLRDQRDIEISKGRFSESFGTKLHGGMYSSPVHAVPKAGSNDFRLVTDQSIGLYSLNSMIDHVDIAGMPMDDMKHFGEQLLAVHGRSSQPLTLWKSDVAEAYRLCPMHPHWQIKQVNTIDGKRHIDRNNAFGGRGSFNIWGSVNSLVTWIAKHVYHIEHPLCFNDDSYGVCSADDLEFYEPYKLVMPRDQWKLLSLWDLLGIPHKEKKQKSGSPLTIIGIEVDPNKMTMTLPAETRDELVAELRRVTAQPNNVTQTFYRREFERLAGWMNWAFDVFPLLRPSLSNVYAGIAKTDTNPKTQMQCNQAMKDDLTWALKHITSSEGLRLLDCRAWGSDEANITLYTDSCLGSLAFWDRVTKLAFYCDIPSNTPSQYTLYLKALCVASAFLHAAAGSKPHSKIIIYTDNSSIVKMFNSFRVEPLYNPLLKAVADVMIKQKHQLKVLRVPGEENSVANFLSRKDFAEATRLQSRLVIKPFQPRQDLLGAVKVKL